MDKVVLLGCGGHALSVIDSIKSKNQYTIVGILDQAENVGKTVLGVRVIGTDELLTELYESGVKKGFICVGSVGSSELRRKLVTKLNQLGFIQPSIIDPSAIVSQTARMGKGVYIGKGAIVNACSKIGDFAIINSGSIVEHEVEIGEFAHIAPGATLCGDVKIGNGTHIGAATVVIQGITVGDNSLIGAGSTVVKEIGSNCKAYGTPCKVVE